MKFTRIPVSILAFLCFITCIVAEDQFPISGSFTNTTISLTNNVSDQYIISSLVWGFFDGATECKMDITFPDTSTRPMVFARSTSATNSLAYLDGDAALMWKRLGVITLTVSSSGTTTNGYLIQTTTAPRK